MGGRRTPAQERDRLALIKKNIDEAKDDESRLKPMLKELKDDPMICGAFLRKDGTICIDAPHVAEDGRTNGRCWSHGGASTGPISVAVMKEDVKRLHTKAQPVYMISVDRFIMTAAENSFYIDMMNEYIEEHNLDTVNIILLDRALRNFFMNSRKEIARAGETVPESRSNQDFDTKSLRYFQALGFDRKFVQSVSNSDNSQKIDLAQIFTLQGSEPEQKRTIIEENQDDDRGKGARAKITGEKERLQAGLVTISQKLPKPPSENFKNISDTEDEDPALDRDNPEEEEILDD